MSLTAAAGNTVGEHGDAKGTGSSHRTGLHERQQTFHAHPEKGKGAHKCDAHERNFYNLILFHHQGRIQHTRTPGQQIPAPGAGKAHQCPEFISVDGSCQHHGTILGTSRRKRDHLFNPEERKLPFDAVAVFGKHQGIYRAAGSRRRHHAEVGRLDTDCIRFDPHLNEPRYPRLPDILKAKEKPVTELTLSDLGISDPAGASTVTGLSVMPERRVATMLLGSVEEMVAELVNRLSTEAKVL